MKRLGPRPSIELDKHNTVVLFYLVFAKGQANSVGVSRIHWFAEISKGKLK